MGSSLFLVPGMQPCRPGCSGQSCVPEPRARAEAGGRDEAGAGSSVPLWGLGRAVRAGFLCAPRRDAAARPPWAVRGRHAAGALLTPCSPRATAEPPSGGCGCLSWCCTATSREGPAFGPEGRGGRPRGGQPGLAPRGQQRGRGSGGAGCPSEPESHLERGPSHCPVLREVRTTYPARGWGWWDGVALETLPQPGRRSEARTGGWAGAGARRGWRPSRRGTAVPGARPRTSPGRHSGTSRHFG